VAPIAACEPVGPPLFPLDEPYSTGTIGLEEEPAHAIEELGVGFQVQADATDEEGIVVTAWWEATEEGNASYEDGGALRLGPYTLRMEFEGAWEESEVSEGDLVVVYPTAMMDSEVANDPHRPRPVLSIEGESWEVGARQTGVPRYLDDSTLTSDAFNNDETRSFQAPARIAGSFEGLRMSSIALDEG